MYAKLVGFRIRWLAVLVASTMVATLALPTEAQTGGPYDLSWGVVAGGGGKSRDGTGLYSLRGTVGQPAAGSMSGGAYSVTSGFWAIPPQRAADVNGDGAVDVVDLLWLVESFGTVEGDAAFNPACDFNDDGSVDVVDLLTLVYAFGT